MDNIAFMLFFIIIPGLLISGALSLFILHRTEKKQYDELTKSYALNEIDLDYEKIQYAREPYWKLKLRANSKIFVDKGIEDLENFANQAHHDLESL